VHLVHTTEINKTPRHHPLVTGFLGNTQRLFAQCLRLRNVVPRERRQVIERQISKRFALALSVPRRLRARAHVLRFNNRLQVARLEHVDLAAPLIDFRDAPRRHRRHYSWSHCKGTGIKVEGCLGSVGVLRFVTGEYQIIKRLLPGLTLHKVVG
jgi:hypothetical protein